MCGILPEVTNCLLLWRCKPRIISKNYGPAVSHSLLTLPVCPIRYNQPGRKMEVTGLLFSSSAVQSSFLNPEISLPRRTQPASPLPCSSFPATHLRKLKSQVTDSTATILFFYQWELTLHSLTRPHTPVFPLSKHPVRSTALFLRLGRLKPWG